MWKLPNPYVCSVFNSLSISIWTNFLSPTSVELFWILKKWTFKNLQLDFKIGVLCYRLEFFFKCSSFDAESEYHIQKFFLTLILFKNAFFPRPITKKPRFSRNPCSEHFGENFLETKRKSTSRNPYIPEDNSIRSAVPKIA